MVQPRGQRKSSASSGLKIEWVFGLVVFLGAVTFVTLHINTSSIHFEPSVDHLSTPSLQQNGVSYIQAFDLSINHLQEISFWEGALNPNEAVATSEDFMPIVNANDIDLRWRLKTLPRAKGGEAIRGISAYQIIAETAHMPHSHVWNSGRISVENFKSPLSVEWDYRAAALKPGAIVRWKVLVWDGLGQGPGISEWSKFGVGPNEWTGQWITHPADYKTLESTTRKFMSKHSIPVTKQMCDAWKQRMPMPVARAQFQPPRVDEIASALLVVSGLGMFSATLNGKRLTSASVHDPPLTDFDQRVGYRGFDVTRELQSSSHAHVVGISLGSGWWDARPLKGHLVFMSFMPSGSMTTIAEMHVTYRDGTSEILIPTGDKTGAWKIGKGHLKESNLFTGETIDLVSARSTRGWDTVAYKSDSIAWVRPRLYESTMSSDEWRKRLNTFAVTRAHQEVPGLAPIGTLVPPEMPPVLPMERIAAVSTEHLGDGRWLLDFGKAMSGVVRFEKGLPRPIKPKDGVYPRGHDLSMITKEGDEYITVIHGDSLEMTTGDINLALVAGFGHHSGGERGTSNPKNVDSRAGPCCPPEDLHNYQALTQRDVYLLPKVDDSNGVDFSQARQPRFTVHGFRFAEVCCTETPPTDAYAIQYRTAYPRWGEFSSSNPVLNGAYELTQNALESNTLGVESDCPHRERLQYGGDIVAVSPAAMHFFDLSAFYGKVIRDFTTSQFENGAYGVTSVYMDLLLDQSITKQGAGETIWASAAPVLSARHMRHYGDTKFAMRMLKHHVEWMEFLNRNWAEGIQKMYGDDSIPHQMRLKARSSGLGDWYSLVEGDCWFTHHAFYMASTRAVAYLATKVLNTASHLQMDGFAKDAYERALWTSMNTTKQLEQKMSSVYNRDDFTYDQRKIPNALGQMIGLHSRVVNGKNRCVALRSLVQTIGDGGSRQWPGDEEALFHKHLDKDEYDRMMRDGHLWDRMIGNRTLTKYDLRHAIDQGIFGIRYSLKTLSESGFHNLALTKASGSYFPSYGMMLSFNATTLWETWWRSEDMFSRNHPMLGAVAEWLPDAVAGIALSPTTVGGEELLFWPRIPNTPETVGVVDFASAIQGTKQGDAAIAWKLVGSSGSNNSPMQVVIRALVPPGSTATLRLPPSVRRDQLKAMSASVLPDFDLARAEAKVECDKRRAKKLGFPFHWHYNNATETWTRVDQKKTIGTPCGSFLFAVPGSISWGSIEFPASTNDVQLLPGFYEMKIDQWQVEDDLPLMPGYRSSNVPLGPYCEDPSTFDWDVNDADHLI